MNLSGLWPSGYLPSFTAAPRLNSAVRISFCVAQLAVSLAGTRWLETRGRGAQAKKLAVRTEKGKLTHLDGLAKVYRIEVAQEKLLGDAAHTSAAVQDGQLARPGSLLGQKLATRLLLRFIGPNLNQMKFLGLALDPMGSSCR